MTKSGRRPGMPSEFANCSRSDNTAIELDLRLECMGRRSLCEVFGGTAQTHKQMVIIGINDWTAAHQIGQ
jgi:hypothetical protein